MPTTVSTSEPITSVSSNVETAAVNTWPLWLALAAFAVLWFDLCHQLSSEWSTRDQYAYGWFVPFLAMGLLWKRWLTRPLPSARPGSPAMVTTFVLAGATVLLLPLRIIWEVNPDWPLCSWMMCLLVVAVTLYTARLFGGTKWLQHFAFPVSFILLSVSWPYRIEKGLTQGLMGIAANLTVEILGWFNIPAVAHGNLIDLANGTVGVDEACSGIRSLQSTLMGALFLGELYRLSCRSRSLLVVVGVMGAFLLNVCRTFLLSWQAANSGIEALHKWHDPAGFAIAITCFVLLWVIALLLNRKTKSSTVLQSCDCFVHSVPPLPMGSAVSLAISVAIVLIGKETWFRIHEFKPLNYIHWSVSMPERARGFVESSLPEDQLNALKCDQHQGASWEDSGSQWSVWWFRWNLQSMKSLVAARCHKPETCLPASGRRLKKNYGLRWYDVGNLKLPFRRLIFENGPQPLYVFFCLWQDGTELFPRIQNLSIAGRLYAALNGRRLMGQQTVEIVCSGYGSFEEADAAVAARLPELIRVEHF